MKNFFFILVVGIFAFGCAHNSRAPSSSRHLNFFDYWETLDATGHLLNSNSAMRTVVADCHDFYVVGDHDSVPVDNGKERDFKEYTPFSQLQIIYKKGKSEDLEFKAPYGKGFPYGVWRTESGITITFEFDTHPSHYMFYGNNVYVEYNRQKTRCTVASLIQNSEGGSPADM